MLNSMKTAVLMVLTTTLLFGVLYPLAITGIAQVMFPAQANGSLLTDAQGKLIGLRLIGQNFTGAGYFHPRPSAAGANGYDAATSGGSISRRQAGNLSNEFQSPPMICKPLIRGSPSRLISSRPAHRG